MACSECSGRRTSQVDDKVEYPWQTEAWMMENLFLKKENINEGDEESIFM